MNKKRNPSIMERRLQVYPVQSTFKVVAALAEIQQKSSTSVACELITEGIKARFSEHQKNELIEIYNKSCED